MFNNHPTRYLKSFITNFILTGKIRPTYCSSQGIVYKKWKKNYNYCDKTGEEAVLLSRNFIDHWNRVVYFGIV